jgi:hypothetical protein
MFDRIARGWELAKSSAGVLYSDKKLVLFPIVSGLGTLLVLASFIGPLVGLQLAGKIDLDPANNNGQPPVWIYAFAFAFYFCTYFVIIFCNAALVSCAIMRFNGQEPTLGDGFAAAARRLPQIFAWALVSATVGMLLKAIENAHEKVGEVISAVLGTAWTVVTFFVVPVLVVEKTGPFEAISRSMAILKKTWGEALVGNLGLGLFKFLLVLPGILLLIGGVALLASLKATMIPGVALLAVGVLWLLLASAIGAALSTIFLSALYQYAAFDQVPAGFDRRTMEEAFTTKRAA